MVRHGGPFHYSSIYTILLVTYFNKLWGNYYKSLLLTRETSHINNVKLLRRNNK